MNAYTICLKYDLHLTFSLLFAVNARGINIISIWLLVNIIQKPVWTK